MGRRREEEEEIGKEEREKRKGKTELKLGKDEQWEFSVVWLTSSHFLRTNAFKWSPVVRQSRNQEMDEKKNEFNEWQNCKCCRQANSPRLTGGKGKFHN